MRRYLLRAEIRQAGLDLCFRAAAPRMYMLALVAFALAASYPVAERPSPPRDRSSAGPLATQRIENGRRLCLYEPVLEAGLSYRGDPRLRRYVALSERCPTRDPGEDSLRARRIPSMATLESSNRSGNERICSYRYLERRYIRAIPVSRSCPFTPHFNH